MARRGVKRSRRSACPSVYQHAAKSTGTRAFRAVVLYRSSTTSYGSCGFTDSSCQGKGGVRLIIGTKNNVERTYERDMEWSRIMRRPNNRSPGCDGLRVCDADPTIWCDKCKLPVVLVEATRSMNPKPTTYIKATADKLGIPSYLAQHGPGEDGKEIITVTRLGWRGSRSCRTVIMTEDEWVSFCEKKYREHNTKIHNWSGNAI